MSANDGRLRRAPTTALRAIPLPRFAGRRKAGALLTRVSTRGRGTTPQPVGRRASVQTPYGVVEGAAPNLD